MTRIAPSRSSPPGGAAANAPAATFQLDELWEASEANAELLAMAEAIIACTPSTVPDFPYRLAARRPDVRVPMENTLAGSYLALIPANRAYFAAP